MFLINTSVWCVRKEYFYIPSVSKTVVRELIVRSRKNGITITCSPWRSLYDESETGSCSILIESNYLPMTALLKLFKEANLEIKRDSYRKTRMYLTFDIGNRNLGSFFNLFENFLQMNSENQTGMFKAFNHLRDFWQLPMRQDYLKWTPKSKSRGVDFSAEEMAATAFGMESNTAQVMMNR